MSVNLQLNLKQQFPTDISKYVYKSSQIKPGTYTQTLRVIQLLNAPHRTYRERDHIQVNGQYESINYKNGGQSVRECSQQYKRQQIDFYPSPPSKSQSQNRTKNKTMQQSFNSSNSSTSSDSSSKDKNDIDHKIKTLIASVCGQEKQSYSQQSNSQDHIDIRNKQPPMIYDASQQPSQKQLSEIQNQIKQNSFVRSEIFQEEQQESLLPPQSERDRGKKTLVLDLDETLVHSQFKPINNPDIVQPVEIDGKIQHVYVLKRPFCEEFILRMSHYYEIVMFTASLSKYAQPLYKKLDKLNVSAYLLYREHCTFYNGLFVKDMARLGRPLQDVIIIDNSPTSFLFQPENALPSISWYDDQKDRELLEFIPILEKLANVRDVRNILPKIVEENRVNLVRAKEILNLGSFINPEEDNQPQLFTPPRQNRNENQQTKKYFSSHKEQKVSYNPQVQILSTNITSLNNFNSRTPKYHNQSNNSVRQKEYPDTHDTLSSVQNSIDQFKRHQVLQQKQKEQIDDIKKRILSGNHYSQTPKQKETPTTFKYSTPTSKNLTLSQQDNNIKSSNYINSPKAHESSKTTIGGHSSMKQEKENKYSSPSVASGYSLTTDRKYQEYLSSLQKHQKRSGSQQLEKKFSGSDNQSRNRDKTPDKTPKQKSANNSKRCSSAIPKNPHSTTSGNSVKTQKSGNFNSGTHNSKGMQKSESCRQFGSKNVTTRSSHNFNSTPDKGQSSGSSRGQTSAHNTPKKAHLMQSSLSQKKLHLQNSQGKKESSFSTLQQKTQDLKRNFANFIKSIESNSPIVSQQQSRTNLKYNEKTIKSPNNKFIKKFEQQVSQQSSITQENNHQLIKSTQAQMRLTPTPNMSQKQQNQNYEQSNKNHLQHTSIYNKLTQQNTNFALSPQSFSLNQQYNSQAIKAHFQTNNIGSPISQSKPNMSSQQPGPGVNLIALQMLKHSPYSKNEKC